MSRLPSPVEGIRTDDAAQFESEAFADYCQKRGIRQNLQLNSVLDSGIAMIESAGKAAAIRKGLILSSIGVHPSDSLWAAQAYWVCHVLNSTATTSNLQCKTSYEM